MPAWQEMSGFNLTKYEPKLNARNMLFCELAQPGIQKSQSLTNQQFVDVLENNKCPCFFFIVRNPARHDF